MDPYGAGIRGGNRRKRREELEGEDQVIGQGAQPSVALPSGHHGSNMKGQ